MDGQSPHRGKSLYMMMLLPLQGEYHMNTKSQGDAQGYEIAGLSARLCLAQNVEEVGGRRRLAELDEFCE